MLNKLFDIIDFIVMFISECLKYEQCSFDKRNERTLY